ncbi:MAG: TIGR00282 family metallophosphoesterase [Acutalibacteraceae bacterium]
MKILMIGDVVSKSGCEFLRRNLPSLKRETAADFTIVNGENSAEGNGITPKSAQAVFESGADVITNGNHTFRRKEIYDMLDENEFILRPANYPPSCPGRGFCVADMGKTRIAVINLMGNYTFMSLDCPFRTADKIIEGLNADGIKNIFVDFHAEATGEKRAMAFYLDGRVTALCGTHTHIPTDDCEILPGGSAYVTDLGMTGPSLSCLGVKPEAVIRQLKDKMPSRFDAADGNPCEMSGVIIDFDEKSGRANSISRIKIKER